MPTDEDHSWSHICDAELLRQMASEPHGDYSGQAAWAEFYERHHKYIYSVCRRAYTETIGEARVPELVQDTFIRAYERARTYEREGELDGQAARRRVRAWLGRISENIVHDYFRSEPQVTFVDEEELGAVEPLAEAGGESEGSKKLGAALAKLTDREQEVLRTTALWYRPGQRQQRLPNSVMKTLVTSLKTTPDNVRQIRVRAISKLKALMGAGWD